MLSKAKLLFWMLMLDVGISILVTGRFYFNLLGDLEGKNITFAGSLLVVISMISIYAYFKNRWKEVKTNLLFTVLFLLLFAASITASTVCHIYNIEARPLYWAIFPYIVGYFLHKKLTKVQFQTPEITASSSIENSTKSEK